MTKFHYLALGYALIWMALAFYLISLGRRLRRLSETIQQLRQRVGPSRGTGE